MDAARSKGLKVMTGEILSDNDRILKLVSRLGFTIANSPEDSGVKLATKML